MAKAMGEEEIQPDHGKTPSRRYPPFFADTNVARTVLRYEPRVPFEEGITELTGWFEGQTAGDGVEQASAELSARGLTV